MPHTVADVTAVAESLWPSAGAEDWDAVGLVSGASQDEVHRIHLAVDAVPATAEEAIELGADLLLTHHPLLLRGVTTVAEDRYKGAVLARLIRAGCALLTAHTNADVVVEGTSAVLARALGLTEVLPLVPAADPLTGLGRVGRLPETTTLGALARRLFELLPSTASGVRVSGEFDQPVTVVALCAGAGDGFLAHPTVESADVYITSDLRHHPAGEFRESALVGDRRTALIDISHWAAEWLWLDVAAASLREALPDVTVTVSDLRTDPWDFAIVR